MIVYNIIAYVISVIIYFILGDGGREWGAFNILSQLYFTILFLAAISCCRKIKASDKFWINYGIGITALRMFYTTICIYAPTNWVFINTINFGYLSLFSLAVAFIYALKNFNKIG